MKESFDQEVRDMRQPSAVGPESARIEFPCEYPIKVVGDAAEDFTALVCQIMIRHLDDFDESKVQVINSRNGKFQSVRLTIRATGEKQLERLFQDLKATGRVHMVI